ncbi:hypothetical protein GCM10010464_12740 [Pseudonocardia yunnanensis]|uniref:Uncharacterized protein n=1 Tax=Pseudonocardia yunnanensis TaxID=58107 RepID=A0ABW4ES11_9PSEU
MLTARAVVPIGPAPTDLFPEGYTPADIWLHDLARRRPETRRSGRLPGAPARARL